VSRSLNLTEAQLKQLMRQAPTNGQAAKKVARVIYEIEIETAFDQAMVLDGWRPMKQEQNFSERKKKSTGEAGMCDKQYIRYTDAAGRQQLRDLNLKYPGTVTEAQIRATVQVLWIEWKRIIVRVGRKDKASQRSADQETWQQREKDRGALVWCAGVDFEATIDGAAQHYLDSGLARRRELFVALIPPEGRALPDRPRRLGDGE